MNLKSTKSVKSRSPFQRSELWLISSPLLVMAAIGLWLWVRRVSGPERIHLPFPPVQVLGGGNNILIRSADIGGHAANEQVLWDGSTRSEVTRAPWDYNGGDAALSPDGRSVVEWSVRAVTVRDVVSHITTAQWTSPAPGALRWLTNTQLLLTGSSPAILDPATGKILRTLNPKSWFDSPSGIQTIALNSTGTRAAILEGLRGTDLPYGSDNDRTGNHGRIAIVTWPAGKLLDTFPGDVYGDPAWTSDGFLCAPAPLLNGDQLLSVSLVTFVPANSQFDWLKLPANAGSEGIHLESYRLSPDATSLAALLTDHSWIILDANNGRPRGRTSPPAGHFDSREAALSAFTGDGQHFFRPVENTLEIWSLANLKK